MTIICDATALILLAKIDLLETLANRNELATSPIVYQEVARGKEKARIDSLKVEQLVKANKLKIEKPSVGVKIKMEKLFNIKYGELEVISMAFKTRSIILSDDKKCLNVAKTLRLRFITSLDVVIALYKHKAISRERALECINLLEEYGWYSKDIIKEYWRLLK